MTTDEELQKIISGNESDRVEFTASGSDLDKIRQAICAFANDLPDHKKPGYVVIGLADNKDCANLTIDDHLLTKCGGLRSDGNILPFPIMTVGKHNVQDCEIAVIRVEPSENPPLKVDGRCWIRIGPRRGQASAEEERRLMEKRRYGNLPYDMHGVKGASVQNDLDILRFEKEYLPASVSKEVLQENDRSREDQLKALCLISQHGNPTVTAILMLGKDPMYWFPGAYIQFVRYEGNEVTDPIIDQKSIHGTLPDQMTALDEILKINIHSELSISGIRHTKKQNYPFVALRELVCNAVIHRNYENSNTPVRINWFKNKIDIISSGSLFGEVTEANFGDSTTSYRNPTITGAMKNMGFVEKYGIGIRRARKALQENGNPPPEFDIGDTYILVTIKEQT